MHKNTLIAAAATGLVTLSTGLLAGAGGGFLSGRVTAPTPEACIVALDEGERVLGLTSDALGLAADAVVAAAEWDNAELDRITVELDGIITDLGDPDVYLDARDECEAGAR